MNPAPFSAPTISSAVAFFSAGVAAARNLEKSITGMWKEGEVGEDGVGVMVARVRARVRGVVKELREEEVEVEEVVERQSEARR